MFRNMGADDLSRPGALKPQLIIIIMFRNTLQQLKSVVWQVFLDIICRLLSLRWWLLHALL